MEMNWGAGYNSYSYFKHQAVKFYPFIVILVVDLGDFTDNQRYRKYDKKDPAKKRVPEEDC